MAYYRGLPQKSRIGAKPEYTPPPVSTGTGIRSGSGQSYNYNVQSSGLLGGSAVRPGAQQYQLQLNNKPVQKGVIDPSAFVSRSDRSAMANFNQSLGVGQRHSAASTGYGAPGAKKYGAGPYDQMQQQQGQQNAYGSGSMDEGTDQSSSDDPLAYNLDTWRQLRQEEDERAQRNRKQDNNTAAWAFFASQLAGAFNPVPYDTSMTAQLSSQWR
jgi:hypothetical protein